MLLSAYKDLKENDRVAFKSTAQGKRRTGTVLGIFPPLHGETYAIPVVLVDPDDNKGDVQYLDIAFILCKLICECGAKHSGNPQYHQSYCPLTENK